MCYREQLFELLIQHSGNTATVTAAAKAMTNDYIWTLQQMVRVEKFRL